MNVVEEKTTVCTCGKTYIHAADCPMAVTNPDGYRPGQVGAVPVEEPVAEAAAEIVESGEIIEAGASFDEDDDDEEDESAPEGALVPTIVDEDPLGIAAAAAEPHEWDGPEVMHDTLGDVTYGPCHLCGKGRDEEIHGDPVQSEPQFELGGPSTDEHPNGGVYDVNDPRRPGYVDPKTIVDGKEAVIDHRPGALPIAPPSLADCVLRLEQARERYERLSRQAKDAVGFKKDAQGWVNTCVDALIEAANREKSPKLPLEDPANA